MLIKVNKRVCNLLSIAVMLLRICDLNEIILYYIITAHLDHKLEQQPLKFYEHEL